MTDAVCCCHLAQDLHTVVIVLLRRVQQQRLQPLRRQLLQGRRRAQQQRDRPQLPPLHGELQQCIKALSSERLLPLVIRNEQPADRLDAIAACAQLQCCSQLLCNKLQLQLHCWGQPAQLLG